eukprot:c13036_g1_i1.p1 GENE.c13036_g1_i1~~c13036_g1_i1.p1  ORF type:complete len:623 (+),score=159.59 c13036_g1_i1:35-1870(+)
MTHQRLVCAVLVLCVLVGDVACKLRISDKESRYHFGPHNAHKYNNGQAITLSKQQLKEMILHDLTSVHEELSSILQHAESLEQQHQHSFSDNDANVVADDDDADFAAEHHNRKHSKNHRSAHILEEPTTPSTRTVTVPAEIRERWEAMQSELTTYYTAKRSSVTLDTKFNLFAPAATKSWVGVIKSLVTLELADTFQDFMGNFETDLLAGKLFSADKAMGKCKEASTAFLSVAQASSVTKGIINAVSMGVADSVSNVTTAFASVADELVTTLTFESIQLGSSLLTTVLDQADKAGPSARSGASIAVNATDTTARVAGDVTYGIVTLGIGPLIGFLTGKVIEGIEMSWIKDKQTAACILGAFAAVSESLGVRSSVGAQGVQYRVTSEEALLPDSGKFTALMLRAKKEFDVHAPGQGIISSEDVYDLLEEDFQVISKFHNAADILKGPGSGISDTIRQYANGNEFEKSSKYAGANLVAFLKNTFWKEMFQAVTQGSLPLIKAGFLKNVVVSGNTKYKTLYARFGRIHDYGPGGEYDKSYDCEVDKSTGKGECWVYCGADWKGGEWCYTQDPTSESKMRLPCTRKKDCYDAVTKAWPAFQDIKCGSTCVLFWHV